MSGKFIIFIGGCLAAGKTTFSRRLSKELRVLCVNKDYVKEILCDGLGFADRAENLKMSHATFDIMLHIAEQSMKAGAPLILESNFRKYDAERFMPLLRKYGYTPVTVFFDGDLEVLFKRFAKRLENRHTAHTSVKVTWADYVAHSEELRLFDVGGKRITVDATQLESVDYGEIITSVIAASEPQSPA